MCCLLCGEHHTVLQPLLSFTMLSTYITPFKLSFTPYLLAFCIFTTWVSDIFSAFPSMLIFLPVCGFIAYFIVGGQPKNDWPGVFWEMSQLTFTMDEWFDGIIPFTLTGHKPDCAYSCQYLTHSHCIHHHRTITMLCQMLFHPFG